MSTLPLWVKNARIADMSAERTAEINLNSTYMKALVNPAPDGHFFPKIRLPLHLPRDLQKPSHVSMLFNDFPVIQYADDTFDSFLTIFLFQLGWKSVIISLNLYPINVLEEKFQELIAALILGLGFFPFTYFGLPLGHSKPRIEHLLPLVTRIQRRLQTCSNFLTSAGKLQFTNSVMSSLPTFYLSTSKFRKV